MDHEKFLAIKKCMYISWTKTLCVYHYLSVNGVLTTNIKMCISGLVHIFHDKTTFHRDNDVAILLYKFYTRVVDFHFFF